MSTEVTTLKPAQLTAMLAETIRAQLPVLLVSPPGVGKSDISAQAAAAAGADLVVRHPAIDDPTDYKGMPWVVENNGRGKRAEFLPFGDLEILIKATRPTVCLLDDLGQATNSVQAAAMQLLRARSLNGHKISDKVTFIAATNRRGDRAGVQGILEPVKSRFVTIVELAADLNDWCSWAIAAGIPTQLIAFMRFRPALLSDFKATADMTNSPCPRTWEGVSKIIGLNLESAIKLAMYEGAVGPGAAHEWVAFERVWQSMVSPDVILTNPETADIPKEASALFAVSEALAARVSKQSLGRYFRYMERLVEADKDEFAVMSIRSALARDPKLHNDRAYVAAMSGAIGQLLI